MKSLRKWATPVTIGSFLVMGVTGVLMFLHLDSGLNKVAHEWAGLIMVVAVIAHLLLNFRAFSTYFKRPLALGLIGTGALILAVSFLPMPGAAGGPDGMRAALMAMSSAKIETLAELAGKTPDDVLASLGAAGYTASADETLTELAGDDRGARDAVLGVIFAR